MSFLLPVLAAILQAGSFTVDKIILSIKKVDFKLYIGVSFPLIFLINLCLFLIFRPVYDWSLLESWLGVLVVGSVGLSIASNLIFYRALKKDTLGEIQSLELLSGIPVIIFSSLIFADERKFYILIPALIAVASVVWSHWEKNSFQIKKSTLPLLIWVFSASPIGASISKILLTRWNPISLELTRSAIISLILGPLFWRFSKHSNFKTFLFLVLTNILTAVAWFLFYFSYQRSGIVYTILIFSLQPMLVYFGSVFFLREKLHWKKALSFAIILLSIAGAQLLSW